MNTQQPFLTGFTGLKSVFFLHFFLLFPVFLLRSPFRMRTPGI